jgi:hypothetical protein
LPRVGPRGGKSPAWSAPLPEEETQLLADHVTQRQITALMVAERQRETRATHKRF